MPGGGFSHRKGGYTCAAHSGMLFEILGIHSGMFFANFGIHSGMILAILDPTVIIYTIKSVSDNTFCRLTHFLCVKTLKELFTWVFWGHINGPGIFSGIYFMCFGILSGIIFHDM